MSDKELLLPCLKGNIGDWVYFSAIMSLSEIAKRIHFPKEVYTNEKLSDMIQRSLKENRENLIKDYILNNEDRFFGSLIVGSYGGRPEWFGLDTITSDEEGLKNVSESILESVGFIKLTGHEKLFALDGQHRLAGIRKALKESDELSNEELTIIFVAHRDTTEGVKRTRKLFVSLNKHAVKVSKKDIIALDEVDNYAIITRKLVEEYEPFTNRLIDFSGTTNLKPNDFFNITTITNLYDVIEILAPHFFSDTKVKLKDIKRIRLDDEPLEKLFKKFTTFFDTCFDLIPELKMIKTNVSQQKIKEQRGSEGGHILYRPVGWTIFAQLVSEYLKNDYTIKEAITHIQKEISLQLSAYPFNSTIWTHKKIDLKGKGLCRDVLLYELFELSEKEITGIKTKYKQFTGETLK